MSQPPDTLPEKEATTEKPKEEETSKVCCHNQSKVESKTQPFKTIKIIQSDDAENGEASKRDSWGNGLEFLMSCIALSVGLGNVWRFPFIALENGGTVCEFFIFYFPLQKEKSQVALL